MSGGGYVGLRQAPRGRPSAGGILAPLGPVGGRRSGGRAAALVFEMSCLLDIAWPRLSDDAWRITTWAAERGMTYRRARAAADQLDSDGVVSVRTELFRPGTLTVLDRERVVAGRGDPPPWLQVRAQAWGELVGEHGLRWREQAILAGLLALVDDRDWQVRSATLGSLGEVLGLGYRSLRAGLEVLAEAELVRFEARRGQDCVLTVLCGPALLFQRVERHEPRPQRKERRQLSRDAPRGDGPAGDLAGRLMRRYTMAVPASVGLLRELATLLTKVDAKTVEDRLVAMGGLGGANDPMAVLVDRARRLGGQLDSEVITKRERRAAAAAEVDEAELRRDQERETFERDRQQWVGEDRWLSQVLDDELLGQVVGRARQLGPVRAGGGVLAQSIRFAARRAVAQAGPTVDPAAAVRAGIVVCLGQVGEGGGVDPPLPTARDGPPGMRERLRSL